MCIRNGGFRLKYLCKLIQTGLLLITAVLLSSCSVAKDKQPVITAGPGEITAADPQFQGVLKSINDEACTVDFLDFNYGSDIVLSYSGGTSVYSMSDSLITIDSIEPGAVVEVQYEGSTQMAKTIRPVGDSWSYDDIINWSVDTSSNIFKIADKKYKYTSDIVILNNGKAQDIMCLNSMDELKVYGVGRKIYSIIVKKGHGYIRPENYKDFIGGTVSVGYIMNQPVTNDMLMVVREGTYDVTMRNGNLSGTQTVEVKNDEETMLDMNEFRQKPDNLGKVEFKISPAGADLYINGRQTNYDEPVSLNYGEHTVVVNLMGYSTYSGKLNVNSPNPTVKIDLTEETADIDEETADPLSTSSASPAVTSVPAGSNTLVGDESKIVYDKNHKITVNAPSGAEVYLNGTYKGIAPCSFPKQIGTQTVTLSRNGYVNKSYYITIADDSQDIMWSFQELEAK